jgi:hypothetical protein
LNKAEFLSNFVFHGGRVGFVVLSTNIKVRLNQRPLSANSEHLAPKRMRCGQQSDQRLGKCAEGESSTTIEYGLPVLTPGLLRPLRK